MRNKIIFVLGMLFSCTLFSSHSLTNEPAANTLLSMHIVHGKIKTNSPQSNSVLENYIKLATIDGETFIINKPPFITEKDFVWISLKNEVYQSHGEAIEFSLTEAAKKTICSLHQTEYRQTISHCCEIKNHFSSLHSHSYLWW